MIFQYEQYRSFLENISGRLAITTFRDWDGSNGLLLRHDVDFDLIAAHRLAMVEQAYSVPATYFVMVTSAAYNPMSPRNRGILHEMAQMPLEIGLHFDPSIYGVKPLEDLLPYVAEEAAVIQSITQRPIDSVSIHNPSVHNQYVLFPGYRNAYDPKIFNPELYLSDSRMVFSRDVIDFAERANTSAIQVLLHPLHFTEEGDAYPEIACRLVAQFANELDATFRVNSTYASLMPTDLLSMVRGNREFEGPE